MSAVVIGGGVNGLVAATRLARRGKAVTVLERRDVLGGVAAGEAFHEGYRTPGLLNDTTGLRAYVVEDLDLRRHGLELHESPPPVLFASREDAGVLLPRDPDACEGVLSPADREGYREYRRVVRLVARVFGPLLDQVPPDGQEPQLLQAMGVLKAAVGLRLLGPRDMMEVLRLLPMCAADWVGELFEDTRVRAGLCGPAIYGTWMGPWSPGSATNLLVHEAASGPGVVGGGAALAGALEAAAREAGVEVRTGAAVTRIRVEEGRARGVTLEGGEELDADAVLASCSPHATFLELLDTAEPDMRLHERIENFRARGTTAKVNLALDGLLEFRGRPGERIAHARTGEHVDELERAFDAVKYRRPSEAPALEVYVPSVEDASLAPEGKDVVSVLVHFAPHACDAGWDDGAREALGDRVVETLEAVAPGAAAKVVAREVLTPADLAERYALPSGHVHHGEHSIDQWILRPTPETSRYATPYAGLYLCGAGSHPGGGVTGAPGYLAASVVD